MPATELEPPMREAMALAWESFRAGSLGIGAVDAVHVLAPDPLSRGVERAREINEFIEQGWPTYTERDIDEWSALALLFQTHVGIFWGSSVPGWNETLPSIAAFATELVASGELPDSAHVGRLGTVDVGFPGIAEHVYVAPQHTRESP